jgi:hypothetical protein
VLNSLVKFPAFLTHGKVPHSRLENAPSIIDGGAGGLFQIGIRTPLNSTYGARRHNGGPQSGPIAWPLPARLNGPMPPPRPQKITFGEMRSSSVRGLLVYCADYHCSHSSAISADPWPDQVRLSDDLEPRFTCKACGRRGADVRPDFHWNKPSVAAMGYR